ncbi:hypothetical protein BDZ97DRAFT_1786738, partial [Flammula alnicola]
LYGLFKYLTSSRMPSASRPSIFDMTGRAKWDAWAAVGKKYEQANEVEQRYLEIARSLGWTELAEVQPKKESKSSTDEDIWDSDNGSSSGGSSRGDGGGLGVSVSSIAPPPKVLDNTGYAPIHLACDRGNTEIVNLLLQRGADRNIKVIT